ncbi:MAG: hypothetical protein M1336_02105 [Deltaproteobacteria bacterium]|nr:hypothetical protein [Deltaproteobacteria bacterium]
MLLDEQLPRHLARELTRHDVRTVQQQGWAGLKNGELLRRAASISAILQPAPKQAPTRFLAEPVRTLAPRLVVGGFEI